MPFKSAIAAALAAIFVVTGCADPLPRPSLVIGLRLLAITTDSPEAKPGQTVTITPLVVDTEQRAINYEWAACVVPATADDDEADYDNEDCLLRLANGESGVSYLGTGVTAEYTVPAGFFDDPSVVADAYGFDEEIPPALQVVLAALIGVEVTISVDVTVEGETLRAFKRLKVSTSLMPNANPDPVAFLLRKRPTAEQRDADGFVPEPIPADLVLPEPGRCLATVGGVVPAVNTTDDWELVPANLPETYPTYSVVGVSADPDQPFQVVEVDEVYVMQFFSTAGSLENRSDTFVDPNEKDPPTELPGTGSWSFGEFADGVATLPIWIVTRDGRGGTVVCQDEVAVDRSTP